MTMYAIKYGWPINLNIKSINKRGLSSTFSPVKSKLLSALHCIISSLVTAYYYCIKLKNEMHLLINVFFLLTSTTIKDLLISFQKFFNQVQILMRSILLCYFKGLNIVMVLLTKTYKYSKWHAIINILYLAHELPRRHKFFQSRSPSYVHLVPRFGRSFT